MSKKILGVLVLVVLFGGALFAVFGVNGSNSSNVGHSELGLETKTSESTVTVDLTPKEFDGKKFYVDIGVNTHTTDLSRFDLKTLVTLEINGKSISPTSAPSLNGHHNSGTLIFEVDEEPTSFAIKVKDFPDEFMRTFEW